jgi:hypothetical protein
MDDDKQLKTGSHCEGLEEDWNEDGKFIFRLTQALGLFYFLSHLTTRTNRVYVLWFLLRSHQYLRLYSLMISELERIWKEAIVT